MWSHIAAPPESLPEALANSVSFELTTCIRRRPPLAHTAKQALFHLNPHSPTLRESRSRSIVKMVQYYSVAGAKVGSHYVSSCFLPPPKASSLQVRDDGDDLLPISHPVRRAVTDPGPFLARYSHPGHPLRRCFFRDAWRRQEDPSGSPDQRFQQRRGRLHQVPRPPQASTKRISR